MAHETIYLQIEEPIIPGDMGYEGATWCHDQINETDIKYVLATQLSASEERVRVLSEAIEKAQALVNKQAEDEGLWFQAQTAPEAYLQQELRKLHTVIERQALGDRP